MNEQRPKIDAKALAAIDEWDKYLSKNAQSISNQATAETKIMFDGSSETNGGLNTAEVKDRIGACREAYENVGIVGNIIDLMVDFAIEDFTIVHTSKSIQNFYINWARKVGLYRISEQILKSLYRDSNVPILTMRGKLNRKEATKLKKAIADDLKSVSEKNVLIKDNKMTKSNVIPIAYKLLDVLKFDKEGGELLGGTAYKYFLPSEEYKWVKNPQTPAQREAVTRLDEIYGKGGANKIATDGYIYLPPDRVSVLYYKKDDYRKWANPMLWRVVQDVRFKQTLRAMDISVAESVQNTITLIKLGSLKDGLAPSAAAYARFVNLLKIPSKSKTIVWDDLVDMQAEYPPVDKILGKEKYEQVDDDIRAGLGIPEVLINGGGGNYANSFLSVKTLMERLETGRNILIAWLNEQIKIVAKSMGFRSLPWVKFRNMSLTDEEAERRVMLELVDRNMMSVQTALDRIGENYEIEIQRMKEEDKERDKLRDKFDYALLKTGKFGPFIEAINNDPQDVSLEDQGDTIQNTDPQDTKPGGNETKDNGAPLKQEQQGEKGGRPGGTKKKQQTKRKAKPQGQSISSTSMFIDPDDFAMCEKKTEKAHEIVSKFTIGDIRKKPTPQELQTILMAVIRTLAYNATKTDITEQDVKEALQQEYLTTAPAKLERCVREVVRKSVEKFRKDNGRAPNTKEMKKITSKAYAICTKATQ